MSKITINDTISIDNSSVLNNSHIIEKCMIDYDKRRMQHIPIPAHHIIDNELFRDQIKDALDYRVLLEHFYNEGRISESHIKEIIQKSTKILLKEPNLIEIEKSKTDNVYIIGDIHGQYYDLVNMLNEYNLKNNTFLFLGDYVDRGKFSFEVYFLLLVLKIYYPKNIFLLRGNHETLRMTRYFTFREECIHKYGESIYEDCCESFKTLPLAAVVNKSFYCAHGGISPYIDKIDVINSFDRKTEPPLSGIFCDILWSDPHPMYDTMKRFDQEYIVNTQRNCSYYYTPTAVQKFLSRNNLVGLIRGHEVQIEGYKIHQNVHLDKMYNEKNKPKEKCNNQPSIITIFSAPNYCDAYNNYGAIIKANGDHIQIKKFKSVSHPFYLPNFMDGINWSFPFIGEKTSEFFMDLLKHLGDQESISSDSTISLNISQEASYTKNSEIEQEIEEARIFSGAMGIMRTERECVDELEDEESSELPCCSIKVVEYEDLSFDEAKDKDHFNEKIKSKDNIVEGSSCRISPSVAPDLCKILEKVDLNETIQTTELSVDEKKKVIDVKVKSKGKPKKNKLCCWAIKK